MAVGRKLSTVRNILSHAAALMTFACAAAAAVGQFGRISEACDFANQFAPLWMACGVAAAIVASILGSWPLRGASVIAGTLIVGLGLVQTGPDVFARATTQWRVGAAERPLKIVSFNVWKSNQDPSATAAWILREDPDVIILADAAGKGQLVADDLHARYPYGVRCARWNCSTLLLSKQPSVRAGGLAHGDPENRQGLSAAWATFVDSEGEFTVIAVHMPRPWPYGTQATQQRLLIDDVAQMDRRRMIVAGDFNATPWSFALQRMDRGLGLPRRTRAVFTWPARLPHGMQAISPILPIDQVYASDAWSTVSVARGPMLGSDHYPLVFQLAPNSTTAAAPTTSQR